jgi:hypothetical protein
MMFMLVSVRVPVNAHGVNQLLAKNVGGVST